MTASKPPNPPWRHHYVPKFMLEQWTNHEGKVATYSKLPSGKVVMSWRVPKSIGYQEHLYTFPELGENATSIETTLMSKLDDQAAKIVQRMIDTGGQELSVKEMVWWSHFLLSLIIRGPESVQALKQAAAKMWDSSDPKTQEDYVKLKGPDDPDTLEEWLASEADQNEIAGQRLGAKILHSLVMNQNVAEHLRQLHWFVVQTPKEADPFLTSDRPLFSSNGLKKRDGQIVLPIAPHSLFCAFYDEQYAKEVMATPTEDIVDMTRKLVTVRAKRFVYGSTSKEKDFLAKWLGYEQTASMGETLAKGWLTNGLPLDDDGEEG